MAQRKKTTSVRLWPEAQAKCEDAKSKGYRQTDFVNQAILGIPYYNKKYEQELMPHYCRIADLVESVRGNGIAEIKSEMVKEMQEICQFLRLPPDGM